jgi:hypothetical protein
MKLKLSHFVPLVACAFTLASMSAVSAESLGRKSGGGYGSYYNPCQGKPDDYKCFVKTSPYSRYKKEGICCDYKCDTDKKCCHPVEKTISYCPSDGDNDYGKD